MEKGRVMFQNPTVATDQLELTLYQPQRQHILNMADAFLVCEEDKT